MILRIQLEIEADYYRFMLLFVHVFSTWPPTCVFVFVQSVQWQESLQFVMNSKIWVKAPSHDYLEDRREEKDQEIIEARLFLLVAVIMCPKLRYPKLTPLFDLFL